MTTVTRIVSTPDILSLLTHLERLNAEWKDATSVKSLTVVIDKKLFMITYTPSHTILHIKIIGKDVDIAVHGKSLESAITRMSQHLWVFKKMPKMVCVLEDNTRQEDWITLKDFDKVLAPPKE